MECPKCHSIIKDDASFCPYCHKVLTLECPNCHSIGESATCQKCGYTILVKCAKCSKITPLTSTICSKCGMPTKTSLAYQECETDDYAALIIKFGALKNIRRLLKSQELYSKFFYKLKNLLIAQVNNIEGKFIVYDESFVFNFNKELSFPTSSEKAVRLALKISNAFINLNSKVQEELGSPLNLNITIVKKMGENLQDLPCYESNVKLLTVKKNQKKYLKGLQITLDQYVWEQINKKYKTDSLFSMEENGNSIMFYEIIPDSYILPPTKDSDENSNIKFSQVNIKTEHSENKEKDAYSFKVFDINAKCHFKRISTTELAQELRTIDLNKEGKIISLRSKPEYKFSTEEIATIIANRDYNVINVNCNELLTYRPWGFFLEIFKSYFSLSLHNRFNSYTDISETELSRFRPIFELAFNRPIKAMTPEDARFGYMEHWSNFLTTLKNTVIIVDGFEKIDDTSVQTLELFFDKYISIKPNFIFITDNENAVHSKIKSLLRTMVYTEFSLQSSTMESCLETLKSDATDFIQSFYFEKIKENFNGSYLYFKNALKLLEESGVLIDFENRLIVKNKKSVMLAKTLNDLYKSRIKNLSKDTEASLILAYSTLLGSRVDCKVLESLGIKNVEEATKHLKEANLININKNVVEIFDFSTLCPIIQNSLKKEVETFLAKTILAQLGKGLDDTTLFSLMGILKVHKEEYLTVWKNAQFAIKTGDYDAYLKNCLGFLSLIEYIDSNIPKEEIEENKKEVYNNILLFLYAYSPAKIYFIENILLMDAIESGDDDKIVKLSNLMLQGALITSNYTDALGLLHNILSRMPHPTLLINGEVNTKFLLLSLVNIEILYNIGDYKECINIADSILSVLSPETIEKVKPASFSTNLFVSHIIDTFRLVAFARLYILDENIEIFFENIKEKLQIEFPEKDAIFAIKDFLAGKEYNIKNVENYSAFTKTILLILQEFSLLKDDYKRFAQNIYQAKLLAYDIHQKEIELFCDLLIAYSYFKIGLPEKSLIIYQDILETAEKSAMYNIILLTKYFLALQKKDSGEIEASLLLINDSLALIQKYNNQSKIFFAIFEKLYIEVFRSQESSSIDIESEENKILDLKDKLKTLLN